MNYSISIVFIYKNNFSFFALTINKRVLLQFIILI